MKQRIDSSHGCRLLAAALAAAVLGSVVPAAAGEVEPLVADPPVTMAVHLNDLRAAFAGCTSLDVSFSLSCRWATHLLCRNRGYASGLGPYELDSTFGIVTCLPEPVPTLWGEGGFREVPYAKGCTAQNPVAVECESLSRTSCQADGFVGSTGVIGANDAVIATFCTSQQVSTETAFNGLGELQAACPEQTFCNAEAILTGNGCQSCGSRFCQSRGHGTGTDVQSFDGTAGGLTCLDGVSPEQMRITTCGATNAKLCRERNGSPFAAQGMNHIHLLDVYRPEANPPEQLKMFDLFVPGFFDEEAMRLTLRKMLADGYNTVRVFIAPNGEMWLDPAGQASVHGLGGPFADGPDHENGLYRPYMDNFMRFLALAQQHSVYVVPILWFLPFNDYYATPCYHPDPRPVDANNEILIDFENGFHLLPIWVEQKRRYAAAFVTYIRDRNQSLLSSILSFELQNEDHVYVDKAPYSLTSGLVPTADGGVYDMASDASRQHAVDANAVAWANTLTDAIHTVDPRAMVSLSTATFDITGRSGPNGVHPGTGTNYFVPNAYPMRPAVLAYWSRLSYVDLHIYKSKFATYDLDVDLASSEVGGVWATPKPLLVGEFGAYKPWYNGDINAAAADMWALRDSLVQRGIGGWLYWTWDGNQPEWFNALEQGEVINQALKP